MMKNIVVIYNHPDIDIKDGNLNISPEDQDTLIGAKKIYNTLGKMGYKVTIKGIKAIEMEDSIRNIPKETLIFNNCEWTGKNSQVPIEMLKIFAEEGRVYTGCSWKDYEWSMEKQKTKEALEIFNFPLLNSTIYENGKLLNGNDLCFPAIVKTNKEHCSVGLDEDSVVYDLPSALNKADQLYQQYQQPILVEEFAEGNEYQVFVFDTPQGLVTLPAYETIYKFSNKPVLITFEDNWINESVNNKVSYIGRMKDKQKEIKITNLARDIFTKMKIRGYIRIDFREKDGKLYVLEVNTNPAISWTDELDFIRVCGEAAGLDYQGLLDLVLSGAKSGV